MILLLMLSCAHTRDLEAELAQTRADLAVAQAELAVRRAEIERLSGEFDDCAGGTSGSAGAGGGTTGSAAATGSADTATLLSEGRGLRAAGDVVGARQRFEQVISLDATGNDGKSASRALNELALVGMPAPTIPTSSWVQGGGAGHGALDVILFFEPWCPHCQRSTPEMQVLLDRWQGRGLTVTGYTTHSRGGTVEGTRAFLQDLSVKFPVGVEDGAGSLAYRVTGIPAVAVVRDGVVVFRGHPSELTDTLLTGLMAR